MIIFTEAPKSKKAKKLEAKFEVPDRIQAMLRKKSVREKMPDKCFLDPKNKKYPICNPLTGKLDCRLVKAAMSRAAGFNKGKKKNPTIFKKAQAIYHQKCSAAKESVEIFSLRDAILESLFIEFLADPILEGIFEEFSEKSILDIFESVITDELGSDYAKTIMEASDIRKFPASLKHWLANREKIPASYFLDPKNKRYPVKGPDGKYNCSLILHARIRAKQHNDNAILSKAESLWKKHCASEK